MSSVSLGYFDVPKCASTSIKSALHIAEYGFPFEDRECSFERGGRHHVHRFLSKKLRGDLSAARHRIIVVRDPVERFLSGYANRVTGHEELSELKMAKKYPESNYIYNPGLGQFLEYLEDYLKVTPIEWHLRPLSERLPGGLDSFTRVHLIKRIDLLEQHLTEIYGKQIRIPRQQTKGHPVSVKQLSSSQLEQIIDFCREDYEMLSQWFNYDQVWHQWKGGQPSWASYSPSRRFEQALRLSRIPSNILIGDQIGTSFAFVSSIGALQRSRPARMIDRALERAGATLSYFALSGHDQRQAGTHAVVKRHRWKVIQHIAPRWLPTFWQHIKGLRAEFSDAKPALVHCYGLRSAFLVAVALARVRSNAALVVELQISDPGKFMVTRVVLERVRLLVIKLLGLNRTVGPLYYLTCERDKELFSKTCAVQRASAYSLPWVNEDSVHVAAIDELNHGVVFVSTFWLDEDEVLPAAELIRKLIDRLLSSSELTCLKIEAPSNPKVDRVLLEEKLGACLDSDRIMILRGSENTLTHALSSQVVVLPSLRHMNARSFILDAHQIGRPVVVPDNKYGRFLVGHGSTGYLFSAGDYNDAAEKVDRLISTRGLPEKMGFKGRMRVESRFTSERAFEVTAEHYLSLLAKLNDV